MKISCPEISCQNQSQFQKDGHYFRKSDSKFIQRYRCKICGKRTSTAQLSACYGQNKRSVNHMVAKLLCSKMSQRRIALILGIDKKTVHRKLIFLGIQAKIDNNRFRKQYKFDHIQFDDLITKEKSKLKPLSISCAVDVKTRKILSMKVSRIASSGPLAKKSRIKYGYRKTELKRGLHNLFDDLTYCVSGDVLFESDEHSLYSNILKVYFPGSEHNTYKSIKGCVAGQGELKKTRRDSLFIINHTLGMLRDNINRLVRRSWCVTQSVEMLEHHLEIYMKFHNEVLTPSHH
jgi:transposase-like protein